jgi:hypothetical protein
MKIKSTHILNPIDLSVLVIAIGIAAILFSAHMQVYAVEVDNTSNLQATFDRDPLYQSTSRNVTSVREVSANQTEISFVEKGIMKNIGNVTNTGIFIDNSSDNGRVLQGVGNGSITTENGDIVSWNAYDIGNETGNVTTFKGAIFFDTNSEKLTSMDNVMGLYIQNISNGNSLRQIWEWK